MLVSEYNFDFYSGESVQRTFVLTDGDGAPLDVGGYVLTMQLRKSPNSAAVDTLTTENGRIVTERGSNEVTINFSVAETRAIPVGAYLYDLTVEDFLAATSRKKIVSGRIVVLPEVNEA